METLLDIGVVLAKLASSPLGSAVGVVVPVGAGLQALADWATGKIKLSRLESSGLPNVDARRESLRRRVVVLWVTQIVMAILSAILVFWEFVITEIPKIGTVPHPNITQTCVLGLLFVLSLLTIVLSLVRARTTLGMDKLG